MEGTFADPACSVARVPGRGRILASVHGVLAVGDKPGYARLLAKLSPLAKLNR